MQELKFLGFVLSFLTTVEVSVSTKASSLYTSGRKRVPQTLDGVLDRVEELVASWYSPARVWVEEKGAACLVALDQLAANSYKTVKAKCASCVPESATKAHSYWVDTFNKISAAWKEHGIVTGSMNLLKEMYEYVKGIVLKLIKTPRVQAILALFEGSKLYLKLKEYFERYAQPAMLALSTLIAKAPDNMGEVWMRLKSYVDIVIEKVEAVTDCVVAHPQYSKGISVLGSAIRWAMSTTAYSGFVSHVYDPYLNSYVSPIVSKVLASELYARVVARLTPLKQE